MNCQQRAAICLNNHGVDLLRKQCFRQGLSCLADAIMTLSSGEILLGLQPICMRACLERAANQMANPEPFITSTVMNQCPVTVVSDETDDCATLMRPHQSQDIGINHDVFLIRIEAFDSADLEMESRDLQSAIVLHNTGSAYRLLAHVMETARNELEASSLHFFHSSYLLITSSCQRYPIENLCKVTMVSILVLQSLTILSESLKLHDHSVVYRNRLRMLLQTTKSMPQIVRHTKVVAEAA